MKNVRSYVDDAILRIAADASPDVTKDTTDVSRPGNIDHFGIHAVDGYPRTHAGRDGMKYTMKRLIGRHLLAQDAEDLAEHFSRCLASGWLG
jgi:hypothetical protein